jgi:hypothetical protein
MEILATKYPGMELTIHIGRNYECTLTEATFIVKDGKVTQLAAQVKRVGYERRCNCYSCNPPSYGDDD